jgi:hypothetical protein
MPPLASGLLQYHAAFGAMLYHRLGAAEPPIGLLSAAGADLGRGAAAPFDPQSERSENRARIGNRIEGAVK